MREHPMWHAGYWEWEASLVGALLIAVALGALFSALFGPLAIAFIVIGLPLHFWGMYRVYRQNPGVLQTIRGYRRR